MKIQSSVMLLSFLLILLGCASELPRPTFLYAIGPKEEGPPTIRYVEPSIAQAKQVEVGDTIVKVDEASVSTFLDVMFRSNLSSAKTVTLRTRNGVPKVVPATLFVPSGSSNAKARLLAPGETFTGYSDAEKLYGVAQPAGAFIIRNGLVGEASAAVFPISPRYVEVYVRISASQTCKPCRLQNIALFDLHNNTWLRPTEIGKVASLIFPAAGKNAPSPVAVPAPTIAGYVANSQTSGSIVGNLQSGQFQGNFSGTTATTITPYYDYTATQLAGIYNMSAAIQGQIIESDNAGWRSFVTNRSRSRLRVGDIAAGEQLRGYLYFELATLSQGPLVLFIIADGVQEPGFVPFQFRSP